MNWAQAKWKYPKLKAMGDKDKDGVKNMFDCKPLNKKKHMVYVKDDGGRRKAGFKGEAGDCFTRAYAITEGKDYKEAYNELQEKFKKQKILKGKRVRGSGTSSARTGVYKEHADQILKEEGYEWVATSGIGKGFQKHIKKEELPEGKNILRVSKHFVASKDKDWHDTYDPSREGTRGVYGYWHKPEEKSLTTAQNLEKENVVENTSKLDDEVHSNESEGDKEEKRTLREMKQREEIEKYKVEVEGQEPEPEDEDFKEAEEEGQEPEPEDEDFKEAEEEE